MTCCFRCKRTGVPLPALCEDERYCADCSSELIIELLYEEGRGYLYTYWKGRKLQVGTWTGAIKIDVDRNKEGKNNFSGYRLDVWFRIGDKRFHGVKCSRLWDLISCKEIKGGVKHGAGRCKNE